MARPNKGRSIGGESNLAQRIAREREERGLSYEALASLMTEAGCSIQGSAIYKIEKADPPRRITVDELLALSEVLKLSIDDLLTPLEVLENQRAQELLREMDEADKDWSEIVIRWIVVHSKYFQLARSSPKLYTVFAYKNSSRADDLRAIWGMKGFSTYDPEPLNKALGVAYRRMLREAEQIAKSSESQQRPGSGSDQH